MEYHEHKTFDLRNLRNAEIKTGTDPVFEFSLVSSFAKCMHRRCCMLAQVPDPTVDYQTPPPPRPRRSWKVIALVLFLMGFPTLLFLVVGWYILRSSGL
jgi:hypothetical protein